MKASVAIMDNLCETHDAENPSSYISIWSHAFRYDDVYQIVYVIRTQQDHDTLEADHLTPQLSVAFREAGDAPAAALLWPFPAAPPSLADSIASSMGDSRDFFTAASSTPKYGIESWYILLYIKWWISFQLAEE